MVLLTAPPAILGRALGVRIDDFRLTGHGVFYASRGVSHVPALLRREVAARRPVEGRKPAMNEWFIPGCVMWPHGA
jgi:hypothetical protein